MTLIDLIEEGEVSVGIYQAGSGFVVQGETTPEDGVAARTLIEAQDIAESFLADEVCFGGFGVNG